jgi:imidazolonepropionase-like amidohydrolase
MKAMKLAALAGSIALVVAAADLNAQGQQALVIQGGTLIDGNGGAPVPNSIIVIQGNQITAAGPAAQVQVPAGAQVINAAGKYIVPGLWDAQTNYSTFWGELFLNQGVTSQIDIGLGGETSIAYRDAVNKGFVRGPRSWIGVAHFGGVQANDITGYETPFDGRQLPKTFEDVQKGTKALLDAGADMIMFHSGDWDPAWVKWACDTAHAAGKPCFQRAGGPKMTPREAAAAGVDAIHHSTGVAAAVMKDGTMTNNELERYAAMDEAKAKDLIGVLSREQVYLAPNVIHMAPGYPKDWARMETEVKKAFSDPALMAYYDPEFYAEQRATRTEVDEGAVRQRRMAGYLNAIRFHKMYIEAGGRALIGGDTNGGKAPGFIVHEEMEIWQEGGIPRMQILQAATKWPAELMRVQNRLGTVERGKLADLVIVNADPLADIANLRNIDNVIMDGKVVDRTFHASFSSPFGGHDTDERYSVEKGQWVRALKRETFGGGGGRGGAGVPNPTASPQPAIETIAPTRVTQGMPTTLTLKGFGFVARTRVMVDGISVPYRRISPTELAVTLDPNLLARAGRYDIVVQNPSPVADPIWGAGTSNTAHLIVAYR